MIDRLYSPCYCLAHDKSSEYPLQRDRAWQFVQLETAQKIYDGLDALLMDSDHRTSYGIIFKASVSLGAGLVRLDPLNLSRQGDILAKLLSLAEHRDDQYQSVIWKSFISEIPPQVFSGAQELIQWHYQSSKSIAFPPSETVASPLHTNAERIQAMRKFSALAVLYGELESGIKDEAKPLLEGVAKDLNLEEVTRDIAQAALDRLFPEDYKPKRSALYRSRFTQSPWSMTDSIGSLVERNLSETAK